MFQLPRTGRYLPCFAVLLTGCGTARVVTPPPLVVEHRVVERIPVPAELLRCQVPLPDGAALQSDVADYVLELFGAARNCQSNIEGIKAVVEH